MPRLYKATFIINFTGKPNADNTKLVKEQIDYQNPTRKDFLQFVPLAHEMQHSWKFRKPQTN